MSQIGERFNQRAAHYDNLVSDLIGEFELRQIRHLIPAGVQVLDYGCGTGRTTLDLLQRGCQVTAYDISVNMLAEAEEKASQGGYSAGGPHAQALFTADAVALQGRLWPYVSLIGVLDYYPQPEPILRLVMQYLAPGGRLVVTFPNGLSPLAWLYAIGSRFTVPATPRTPAFIKQAARRVGMDICALYYAFPAVSPLGHTLVIALERAPLHV